MHGRTSAWVGGGALGGGQWDGRAGPLKTLPGNYRLVFENAQVAVIRAHYGPHEKVPVHDHPGVATVFVYLNDSGAVRIDHQEAGGTPESVVRPPTKLGAYRVAPALAERHSLENLGDVSSEFLRVEMKGVTLGIKEPFRGKAPAEPMRDGDLVEFNDPAVKVERIVCVDAVPCGVKAEDAGSLVVALTAVKIGGKTMEIGDVRCVGGGELEDWWGWGEAGFAGGVGGREEVANLLHLTVSQDGREHARIASPVQDREYRQRFLVWNVGDDVFVYMKKSDRLRGQAGAMMSHERC